MPIHPLLRAPILCGALLMGGCVESYRFVNLHSRFHTAELPSIYSTGKRGVYASGYAVANDQGSIRYRKDFRGYREKGGTGLYEFPTPYADTAATSFRGDYDLRRDPLQLGGSLVLQGLSWFCGFSGGLAAPQWTDGSLGTFGGFSSRFGPVVPSLSIGLFAANYRTQGEYWSSIALSEEENPHFSEGTADDKFTGWQIPVKFGLLYRLPFPLSPYAGFTFQKSEFWGREERDPADFRISHREFALGLRYEGFSTALISVEVAYARMDIPDAYEGAHFKWKTALQKKL